MPDTGLTLLAFGIAAIAVTLLLTATVLTVRVRGWRRLYWACCAILIAGGSARAASALCCPTAPSAEKYRRSSEPD